MTRRLGGDLAASPLGGVLGWTPTFSPDGTWVAFYHDDGLFKIRADGTGPAVRSWGRDGTIYFAGGGSTLQKIGWVADTPGSPVDSLVLHGDTVLQSAVPARRRTSAPVHHDRGPGPDGSEGRRRFHTRHRGGPRPDGHTDGSSTVRPPHGPAVVPPGRSLRPEIRGGDRQGDPPRSGYSIGERPVGGGHGSGRPLPAGGGAAGRPEDRPLDREGRERYTGFPLGPWIDVRVSPTGTRIATVRWGGAERSIWVGNLATRPFSFGPDGRMLYYQGPGGGTGQDIWKVAVPGRERGIVRQGALPVR